MPVNFLEERLQQLKIKLQDSEKQLIEYAQQRGIVNVDDKQPEAVANLQAIQNALSAAVTERLKREQLWLLAQSSNSLALPQVASDRLIQASRDRIGTLQASYQEKLSVLKPAFPEMVALRAQITESQKQIQMQMELIKQTIKAEYEAAHAQELALIEKLEEVKTQVLDARGRSIEYTILRREADAARSLYDGLLQQYRELGIVGEVDTNNISIIDRAERPGAPDSPSLRYNLMIAFALGLLGAAAVAGVREVLDDTFKAAEDIEERAADSGSRLGAGRRASKGGAHGVRRGDHGFHLGHFRSLSLAAHSAAILDRRGRSENPAGDERPAWRRQIDCGRVSRRQFRPAWHACLAHRRRPSQSEHAYGSGRREQRRTDELSGGRK